MGQAAEEKQRRKDEKKAAKAQSDAGDASDADEDASAAFDGVKALSTERVHDGPAPVRDDEDADMADEADADAAGTQQAGTGTLVNLTPLPPAGGDGQATTPAHEKPGSTSKLPPAQPEVQAATSTGKYRLVVLSK